MARKKSIFKKLGKALRSEDVGKKKKLTQKQLEIKRLKAEIKRLKIKDFNKRIGKKNNADFFKKVVI